MTSLPTTPLRTVNLRGWPHGASSVLPPSRSESIKRLEDRMGLVLYVAAAHTRSALGLGAFLLVMGPTVLKQGIIIPDNVGRGTTSSLRRWADSHREGVMPTEVVTTSSFFHPYTGDFARSAYTGGAWCIGADLGRTFGLAAEHWGTRVEPRRDTWVFWLPGWGKASERGRWKRVSPHRPCLYATARRVGWNISFGPVASGNGKTTGRKGAGPWRGAFIDLLSLSYSLDGDRGASYGEHRENFGLTPMELPLTVGTDVEGAEILAQTVRGLHEFAMVLDDKASRWFPGGRR